MRISRRVRRAIYRVRVVLGLPKSRADRRDRRHSPARLPALREHLSRLRRPTTPVRWFPWSQRRTAALRELRPARASWPHAVRVIGAEGLQFHDLQHTANTWAAGSGVGLQRPDSSGWATTAKRAAIIYQHEARGADTAITDAIDAHVESKQGKGRDGGGALGTVVHTANGTGASSGLLQAVKDGRTLLTWDYAGAGDGNRTRTMARE